LFIFASPPFYSTHVRFPDGSIIPDKIRNSPKFWPYFKGAIGAIDGSHIHASPPSCDRTFYRNRKGFVSQNCLFACDWDLKFIYTETGWEGSVTDARLWEEAHSDGLDIPDQKYLLGDAGFPSCKELLVPYRGVRYHLAEWGRASTRYIFLFLFNISSFNLSIDLLINKNYTTFVTPPHGTLSKESSAC
jgi:hypothetical protein